MAWKNGLLREPSLTPLGSTPGSCSLLLGAVLDLNEQVPGLAQAGSAVCRVLWQLQSRFQLQRHIHKVDFACPLYCATHILAAAHCTCAQSPVHVHVIDNALYRGVALTATVH